MGFTNNIKVGEVIIPDYKISKSTYENSEGKCIIRKDLPKENAERYLEWRLEDWGHHVHSGICYISYERYQREYLPPRLLEFKIVEDKNKDKWVVSKIISNSEKNYKDIKLAVNILLSIFGECEIINEKIEEPININIVKWEILRPGERITKEMLQRVIKENNQSNEKIYIRNIDKLMQNCDGNIAIGTQEFRGYIVFMHGKYAILESLMPNNATYILQKNWQDVSKLTKTEVLSKKIYIDRIYHYSTWENKIKKYLNGYTDK